jgi:FkbM family methyltransferase
MELNFAKQLSGELAISRDLISCSPMTLIDVGCSGGISPVWRRFEPYLRALGVDPVIEECDRLNACEENKSISYISAKVGLPDDHPFVRSRGKRGVWGGNPWDRLSSKAASEIISARTLESSRLADLNEWDRKALSERVVTVDELALEAKLSYVDFIKIDIDGYDLDAILSAEATIRSSPVLGVALEVNFYGSAEDTDHTFHNTDRLMRQWGFDLFDLSVRRYSASALPARFQWAIPAQTLTGRIYQGDAIYLRDPVACGLNRAPGCPNLTVEQKLKLAMLFELFGISDHAAEILIKYRDELNRICDVANLLDRLTAGIGETQGYEDYLAQFKASPESFYPQNRLDVKSDKAALISSIREAFKQLSKYRFFGK